MLAQQPQNAKTAKASDGSSVVTLDEAARGSISAGVTPTTGLLRDPESALVSSWDNHHGTQQTSYGSPAEPFLHTQRGLGQAGAHADAGSPFLHLASSPASSASTCSSACEAHGPVVHPEDADSTGIPASAVASQTAAGDDNTATAMMTRSSSATEHHAPKFLTALLRGLSSSRDNSDDTVKAAANYNHANDDSITAAAVAAATNSLRAVSGIRPASHNAVPTTTTMVAGTPAPSPSASTGSPKHASASPFSHAATRINSTANLQQHQGSSACDAVASHNAASILPRTATPPAVQEHPPEPVLPAAVLLSSGQSFTSSMPAEPPDSSSSSAKVGPAQLSALAKEHVCHDRPLWDSNKYRTDDGGAVLYSTTATAGSGIGDAASLQLPQCLDLLHPSTPDTYKQVASPSQLPGMNQPGIDGMGYHAPRGSGYLQQDGKIVEGQTQSDMLSALLAYMDASSSNTSINPAQFPGAPDLNARSAMLGNNSAAAGLLPGTNCTAMGVHGGTAGSTAGFDGLAGLTGLAGMAAAGSPFSTPASRMGSMNSPYSMNGQSFDTHNAANMLLGGLLAGNAAHMGVNSPIPAEGNSWEDLTPSVREKVLGMIQRREPYIRLQHFDGGVRHWIVQITTLFGEAAAMSGLSAIEGATNLAGVRNMRAFITTRLIDHFEQHIFQQNPQAYAAKRLSPEQFFMLAELVAGNHGLQWSHFDPKVLDTIRDMGNVEYTRSRLQRLTSRELSAVQNVPAYIFTLLSKRGKTAKQAAASKGATEAALAALVDSALLMPGTHSTVGSPYGNGIGVGSFPHSPLQPAHRSFSPYDFHHEHNSSPGVHRSWTSPLSANSTPYASPSQPVIRGVSNNALPNHTSHLLGREDGYGTGRPLTKNELLQQVSELMHMRALQQQMQAAAAQQGMTGSAIPSPQAAPALGLQQHLHNGMGESGLYNFLNPAAACNPSFGSADGGAGNAYTGNGQGIVPGSNFATLAGQFGNTGAAGW